MSSHFAMLVSPSPAKPALLSGEPAAKSHCKSYPQLRPVAGCDETEAAPEQTRLRADLAGRVLSGPGLWMGWLEDLDRRGVLEALIADGVIDEAVATAPHGHKLDRTLNAKTTLICVLAGCLFPGEGYDTSLRITFGLPGPGIKPGTKVPAGPAYSKARALPGEQVMRRASELDAARADVGLGIGSAWHEMETTAFDGTTAEVFNCDELTDAFGVPTGGTKPSSASSPMSGPGPGGGSAPRSAATTTGRTRWWTSLPPRCGRACSTSPTGVFSPWTAGSGSPPPARTCAGG